MVSRVLIFLAVGLAILACRATDSPGDSDETDADADADTDVDGDTESGTGLDWLCDGPIAFPDPYLEEAVREAIGKPSGDILLEDLYPVTTFGVSGSYYPVESKVFDLTGMQCMRNLEVVFFLGTNAFTNVDPLAAAAHLRVLLIDYAPLEDLNGLGETTQLIQLEIGSSLLDDIGPLTGHQSMIRLALRGQIDSVEPLASMTQIVFLDLAQNNISDISALAGMTLMETLNIGFNEIADISALSGMTALKQLDLRVNQIADISALSGMTELEELLLADNLVSDTSALVGLAGIKHLRLSVNSISYLGPFAEAVWPGIEKLEMGNNPITDIFPLVENPYIAEGVTVNVNVTDLDCESQSAHIQALLDRGVVLYCDCDECY